MTPELRDPRTPDSTVDVGRLVRMHRIVRGLSQTELGNQIGVTFQQVQKYESGANRISMGRLVRIARVLGVSVTDLLGGSRQTAPARSRIGDDAKLAEARRMLRRAGAFRLLRAFAALPNRPSQLRESIVRMVEVTVLAAQTNPKDRSPTRQRSASRARKI